MHKISALLLFALACTPANARAPDAAGGAPTLTLAVAAGDTARGFFSYTAGSRSNGALVTVKATSFPASSWVGLPTDVARPAAGQFSFVATNATADSADLTPCVIWTNASGQSPELCGTARRWRRPPGTGTIGWDSLKVSVRPDTATIFLGSARALCGFKEFKSGHVVVRSVDRTACDSIYVRAFTTAQRAVTAAEQAHEDSSCYAWTSSNALAIPVTPRAACSASSRVDGLQLTFRAIPDQLRYASLDPSTDPRPIATVSSTGLVRCYRGGTVVIRALVEGVPGQTQIHCRDELLFTMFAAR